MISKFFKSSNTSIILGLLFLIFMAPFYLPGPSEFYFGLNSLTINLIAIFTFSIIIEELNPFLFLYLIIILFFFPIRKNLYLYGFLINLTPILNFYFLFLFIKSQKKHFFINRRLPLLELILFLILLFLSFFRGLPFLHKYTMQLLTSWLGFILFFIFLGSWKKTEIFLGNLFNFLIICGYLASCLAIVQFLNILPLTSPEEFHRFNIGGIFVRSFGTFEHPHIFADYLGVVLIIALIYFIFSEKKEEQWFFGFCVFTIYQGLLGTFSRSGIFAFWIVSLFMLFFLKLKYKISNLKIFIICLIILLPLLTVFSKNLVSGRIASINQQKIWSTIFNQEILVANDASDTIVLRITGFKDALTKIKNNLFGLGLGAEWHAHNLFLQICLDMGILGLILFFLILKKYFQISLKSLKTTPLAINKYILISLLATFYLLIKGGGDLIWVALPFWGFLMGVPLAASYPPSD